MIEQYTVIGVMSGTSLDGLDLACCQFSRQEGNWRFNILQAETFKYNEEWTERLTTVATKDAFTYALTDMEYGRLIGEHIRTFVQEFSLKPDFISSHGHTIFHQPMKGLTSQIGHGAAIYAASALPVICDFRTVDVSLGGQGAPLVPIGDQLLFADYAYCLNLGGIANISYNGPHNSRIAYDICPVNIVLNRLAAQLGLAYDDGGSRAAQGTVDEDLLHHLNALAFYEEPAPKSLGIEWIEAQVFPLIQNSTRSTEDKLATFCQHIAIQLALAVKKAGPISQDQQTILVTGGGAFNTFLITRMQEALGDAAKLMVPAAEVVNFKEALIFAFLGLLRLTGQPNCLQSVTGACKDNIGGAMYGYIQ